MKIEPAGCFDCGINTTPWPEEKAIGNWQYYMVRDEIWAEAGMGRGFLCIPCLENRLGRNLVPTDLADVMINIPDDMDTPYLRALKAAA